jgi:hypothetical protein
MTSPPPPAPPAPPAPPPTPPAPPTPPPPSGGPPPPTPPAPPAGSPEEELARLRAVLDDERKQRRAADEKLAKLTADAMTEQERAIATAREEGKAEAAAEHALALAAAEFRAAAAGVIANPEAALAVLDLRKMVKDGKPDTEAIKAAVAQLAAVPAPGGRVPPGPRDPGAPAGDRDWIREQMGRVH